MILPFEKYWTWRWCPLCNLHPMVERYGSYSKYEAIIKEWGSLEDYYRRPEPEIKLSDEEQQWANAIAQTLPLWPGSRIPFEGWWEEDESEPYYREWRNALRQTLHLFDIPELYPDLGEDKDDDEEEGFLLDWWFDPADEDIILFLICPICEHTIPADEWRWP